MHIMLHATEQDKGLHGPCQDTPIPILHDSPPLPSMLLRQSITSFTYIFVLHHVKLLQS